MARLRLRHWAHFNPRSREGSDNRAVDMCRNIIISIHAPAKGATIERWICAAISSFQSTLPRRERQKDRRQDKKGQNFNPRSREGSDVDCLQENVYLDGFQSTLPRRERQGDRGETGAAGAFQSTLPRRERLKILHWYTVLIHFNPRSREGSDQSQGRS